MSKRNKRHFNESQDPIKDMIENFDLGIVSAEEVINVFLMTNDATTESTKVNAISAAVEQEKERILHPLAEKCAQMLALMAHK